MNFHLVLQKLFEKKILEFPTFMVLISPTLWSHMNPFDASYT